MKPVPRLTRRQIETLAALASVFPDETNLVETGPITHERLRASVAKAEPWASPRPSDVLRIFGVPVVPNRTIPDDLLIATNSQRQIVGVIHVDLGPDSE